MPLDEVLIRLSRSNHVEGVLTLGSTRAGELHPHSDYDLLVVLSQMPVPLRVILTTIDGRLTDVLFAHSDLITEIVSGYYKRARTADEGALVERLKTGEVIHDRDGRIRQAQSILADREWLVKPDDSEVYDRAVHGIHYNRISAIWSVTTQRTNSCSIFACITVSHKYSGITLLFGGFPGKVRRRHLHTGENTIRNIWLCLRLIMPQQIVTRSLLSILKWPNKH
jgi:predicted nucleotidyltransferase